MPLERAENTEHCTDREIFAKMLGLCKIDTIFYIENKKGNFCKNVGSITKLKGHIGAVMLSK